MPLTVVDQGVRKPLMRSAAPPGPGLVQAVGLVVTNEVLQALFAGGRPDGRYQELFRMRAEYGPTGTARMSPSRR